MSLRNRRSTPPGVRAHTRLALLLLGMPLLMTATATSHAQEPAPTLPVPPTIQAQDVPPVPRRLADALRAYQNIRVASAQDWAPGPDGQPALLVLTRFGETNQVHRTGPGGERYQLTFHPDRVLSATRRPKHAEFSFTADEGGAENYQIYLQDLARGGPKRLTDGTSRHESARWSPSGKQLAYTGNARNGRDMDVYVLDPGAPEAARRIKEVSGSWTISDWSPDEKSLVAVEYVSINESYLHRVDVASGATQTLTPRAQAGQPTVAYRGARFSADGQSLYVATDRDSEFLQLTRIDLASGAHQALTGAIPWDVEEFELTEDGRTIVLVSNEDGFSRLHQLDTTSGALKRLAVPDGVISDLTLSDDGPLRIALTLSSARAQSDAYVLDPTTGQLSRWTTSETAGFDLAAFAAPDLIRFESFDGRAIPAFVYRPSSAKFPGPRPVLIQIHGGPEAQSRPGFLGRLNYLVEELGIALVVPNVRGSSGYGKTYLKLDNGMLRDHSVRDIGGLLDWIGKQADLDAKRVAVTGGSYGGFMSLAVQTTYNDRIRAGIDVVGISNFVTFLTNTQSYRRDLRRAEYGDERDPAMRAYLEKVSPLNHIERIQNPLLVVQGKNDPRVPLSEAEQVVAAVKKGGKPVWYLIGLNEGHGFAKRPNMDYQQAVEVLFLRRYLLDQAE